MDMNFLGGAIQLIDMAFGMFCYESLWVELAGSGRGGVGGWTRALLTLTHCL